MNSFSFPALILMGLTSIVLLLFNDWRVILGALGIQYVAVFVLVSLTWSIEMAVVKVVAGWIAAAVLGIEMVKIGTMNPDLVSIGLRSTVFKLFLAFLVAATILSVAPNLTNMFLSASYEQVLGSMVLIGMGLLILGNSSQPFRVVVGLLTFLSGIEIIYATVESSSVVAGFLSFFTFGLALIGAYLTSSPLLENNL